MFSAALCGGAAWTAVMVFEKSIRSRPRRRASHCIAEGCRPTVRLAYPIHVQTRLLTARGESAVGVSPGLPGRRGRERGGMRGGFASPHTSTA